MIHRKSLVILFAILLLGIVFSATTNSNSKLNNTAKSDLLMGVHCKPSCDQLSTDGYISKQFSTFTLVLQNETLKVGQKWTPFGEEFYYLEKSDNSSINLKIPIESKNKVDFFSLEIPYGSTKNYLTVKVDNSQWLRVYLNEKLFHTTRYEEPIFILPKIVIDQGHLGVAYLQIEKSVDQRFTRVLLFFALGVMTSYLFLFGIPALKLTAQGKTKRNKSMKALLIAYFSFAMVHIIYWLTNKDKIVTNVYGPSMTPFVPSSARFSDFYQIIGYSLEKSPYELIPINYPPGALLFFKILALFDVNYSYFFFLGFSLTTIFLTIFLVSRSHLFSLASTFSFPVLFAIDRGNVDLFCIAILLYILISFDERPKLSFVLLGLISAIKLWPLVFLIYFAKVRPYNRVKMFITVISFFVCFSILGQHTFGGNVVSSVGALSGMPSLASFEFSISIRGLITLILSAFIEPNLEFALTIFDSEFLSIVVLLAGICLAIIIFTTKNSFLVAYCLSFSILMIPSTTYLYRVGIVLCNIVIAYLHVDSDAREERQNRISLLFMLLLPMHFVPLFGTNIGYETVLTPTLLIFLLFYFTKRSYRKSM